jgi:Ni,Fe-hydrogenase III large subunit
MSDNGLTPVRLGQAIPRREVAFLPWSEFRRAILDAVAEGQRVAAFFGDAPTSTGPVDLYVVLADSTWGLLRVGQTTLETDHFPALTPECPQVHLFEREIAEQYGVYPQGHPWLKPVRFQVPWRSGREGGGRPSSQRPAVGIMDFYRIEGDEVHEVAVGPVHAGIIEPGHFRFQCHGEHVFHLEISLGYQHRGIERALVGGPTKRTMFLMEAIAGDTAVGHATAWCQVQEALSGCSVPLRAEVLRGIALELERLANHTGDLGALAGDVGFLPTAAYCGRLRGDFLNLTALICGQRFGRGWIRPGGVGFDLEEERRQPFLERLEAAYEDVANAVGLLWDSASVQARLEGTGVVSPEDCRALGLVGPAARACGVECDVRHDFPTGIFRFVQIPISTCPGGDVLARAWVRWLEIQRSVAFLRSQVQHLPEGPIRVQAGPLRPESLAVSLVEGWRGEICHVALTDAHGRLARYKIVDPSFHNWPGLAVALRGQQISDFPLCNKSFNLSYCGHDL